jgi:hypothetical protein
MASFSGATFLESRQSDGYPTWDKIDLLIIRARANDDPVIAVNGMDVQRVTVAAQCTAAELTALYDLVLESGSLVFDYETHTAFLESMGAAQQIGIGNDIYLTTLSFIRL